jgi:hypothetical protein
MDVSLADDGETVERVAFTGDGCAISQAAASMLSQELVGMSLDEVEEEVDEKQHEVKLYDYAEEIVGQAKVQIMRNILPMTEAHMARFLPILTNGRYKETVRLFKNARNKLVERNWIEKEEVPSYFVECLLYNVPPGQFVNDLTERYEQIVDHLQGATIEDFRCQNEIHELFGPEPTEWTIDNAEMFIRQLQRLYSDY